MALLAILLITCVLRLASPLRLNTARLSRESKWDIIHHEYHGPPAPLSKDGRVVETPEVAKARSNHLAIHAETVADLAKKMAEFAEKEAMHLAETSEDEAEPGKEETSKPVQEVEEWSAALGSETEGAKPVVEVEVTNELESEKPVSVKEKGYVGPLAPIGEDGRVLDTPEVMQAKEAHLLAHQQAAELTKIKEEPKEAANEGLEWYQLRNQIYLPAAPVHSFHFQDEPLAYAAPSAPIGEYGHAVDTPELVRVKPKHSKVYEFAKPLTKRHHIQSKSSTA